MSNRANVNRANGIRADVVAPKIKLFLLKVEGIYHT